MGTIDIDVLMNKGKRGAATYIQAECARPAKPENLYALLDTLLDPLKPIDDWETVEWCKWLMAGGCTPDEFTSTVRRYDNATTCGLVWTANFVAYRCRTCGISPCMSLCAECFQRGNHKGHDFNMFRSQAGGACDCGDTNVMKESGFCYLHGPHASGSHDSGSSHDGSAPPDLLCVASAMMPRLILRLIQHMRQNSISLDGFLGAVNAADRFITMLHDLSSMGAAMRQVMTHALTNPQVYKSLTDWSQENEESVVGMTEFLRNIQKCYDDALGTLRNPLPPKEFKEIPSLQASLVHKTFLQELVFWTAKFEFPQKIVCLLLNLLPDPEYKEAFTRAFVLHYSRISQLLVRSQDPDMLSNRVVHVSVQLFSNEKLALRMTEQMNLLHVMVISLHYMMQDISFCSPIHSKVGINIRVVDCANPVMKDHCYWPLVSDLNNILSHRPVALKFLQDDRLLNMWFNFLSLFQGMNVNQREMNQHIEFEPTTYYAAFSAELEASASPMWALVSHLKDASTANLTRNLLWHCQRHLLQWLENVKFGRHMNEEIQVSFHLPLHRYFAVFLYQAVRNQGLHISELLPAPHELQEIIFHPLRVQVAFYEIISGLWVRNGLQIKGQAMTYIQCHFCNSMVDADLYLLQIGLMNIPRETFVSTIIEKFNIVESLSICSEVTNSYLEPDHEMLMMENCLIFLSTLCSVRTAIGMSDSDLITLEMITLLCMSDKTHSQLMEYMPERCGNSSQSKDFESVLAKVADYKAPNFESSGNMLQGMYVPKAFVWENDYDPIYILLRAVHRRDFQTSMDRFAEYAKQSGKFKGSGAPWPPFRIPQVVVSQSYSDPRLVLLSRVVQGVLFVIFYKAVHTSQLSDQMVALAVYLLEMALSVCDDEPGNASAVSRHEESYGRYDMNFISYYTTDDLLCNLRTEIDSIIVKPPRHHQDQPGPSDAVDVTVDEMDVDSYDGDQEALEDLYAQSLTAFNSNDFPMDDSNSSPLGMGALALMPPGESYGEGEGEAMVPVSEADHQQQQPSLPAPSRMEEDPMHQTVLQVVLASNKTGGENQDLLQRSSSINQPPSEVMVNESILSLLLKLHSKLSSIPDSYLPFWETPEAKQLISDRMSGLDNGLSVEVDSDNTVRFSYSDLYRLLNPVDSRIGDGPFFIAKLLDKICAKDEICRQTVIRLKGKIWPKTAEDEEAVRVREEQEKEEKRRKAKERQMKLMEEFARKQKQFMEQAMTEEYLEEMSGDGSSDGQGSSSTGADTIKPIEYDCVICNQTSPSTNDNPVGLVILLQPTSILGRRTELGDMSHTLLTNQDENWNQTNKRETMASIHSKRLEEYKTYFNESSWLQSVSAGWEGGVHASSCGHHIHMLCLKGYLAALKSQQRQHSISVDRGEYLCPLCRQLANSFIPLSPEFGIRQTAVVRDRKATQTPLTPETTVPEIVPSPESNVALEIVKLLREYIFPNNAGGKMMDAMTKTMEEMTNVTHLRYRQIGSSQNTKSILLFITSIARTNLELEVVFRGGDLVTEPQPSTSTAASVSSTAVSKRSCIVPLMHVLGVHYKILNADPCAPKLWERIIGIRFFPDTSVMIDSSEVPMLLRDPVTMLLHLLMQLPMHVDLAYFTSMVQAIYNLVYIQIIAGQSCNFTPDERGYWKRITADYPSCENQNLVFIGTVIKYLEKFPFYWADGASTDEMTGSDSSSLQDNYNFDYKDAEKEAEIEARVQPLLLPYLRIAALLRHHLYEQELPSISSRQSEFRSLALFLGLGGSSLNPNTQNLRTYSFLSWISPTPLTTIWTWCEDFSSFILKARVASSSLLQSHHKLWSQPKLMELPHAYDVIFQFYHRKQCTNCNSVSKDPNICLICGTLVCMRDTCCKTPNGSCEAIEHSISCGAGTVIYLSVNSSTVVVVRGRRACLWGSVYLDSFGEEDRELKRGKPLFLSKERYALLQQQWLSHRFDHTNRKWVWHRDNL